MVYSRSPRISYISAPPVGSPDRDPEKEYLSVEKIQDKQALVNDELWKEEKSKVLLDAKNTVKEEKSYEV